MAFKFNKETGQMEESSGRGRPVDTKVQAKIKKALGNSKTGSHKVAIVVGAKGPDVTRAKVVSYCERNKLTLAKFEYTSKTEATITLK